MSSSIASTVIMVVPSGLVNGISTLYGRFKNTGVLSFLRTVTVTSAGNDDVRDGNPPS